jgi:hypothetical protein
MGSRIHSFKAESVYGERFKSRFDAKYQVFEYLEVYYNRKRDSTQNWAISAAQSLLKRLKTKRPSGGVSVKSGQDQCSYITHVTQVTINSRMSRRAPAFLSGTARKGAAGKPRFAKGTGMSLLAKPDKNAGAQEKSGIRVAFSLDTFFWRSKRKYLAFGCENPIK